MFTYISNSAHYKEVLSRVLHVKESLWIGTADYQGLLYRRRLIIKWTRLYFWISMAY